MKHKIFSLLTGLLLTVAYAYDSYAQDIVIGGTVVDTEGQPVIGAGVFCIGQENIGTTTEIDGSFILEVPEGVTALRISSLGMKSAEYMIPRNIPAGGAKIILEYEENILEQVVVTGYSQTTVKRITGSVGIISSDKFEGKPVSSVSALMQGELAGVQVTAVSGQPGTQSRIRIRGTNNLSGSSDPLWVVDGVPLQDEAPDLSSEELAAGGFDNIFVNVQELDLRDLSQARLELHRRYIDIQLLLCGPAETFGWSEAKDCVKAETEFDEAKDIQLFTDIPQCFYTVGEGQFSILFPEDGHAPMLGEGHVKKCIFKVRI